MAVKPAVTKTPQRSTTQYTTGNPNLHLDVTSAATLPNIGSLPKNPHSITLVGADVSSMTLPIGSQTSGASVPFVVLVPFAQLPTPLVVGVSDLATFIVGISQIFHGIAGLVLGEFSAMPIAYTQGQANTSLSDVLQVNQTYTGWAARVSGTLVAIAATSAGTLTVRAHGALYDILG